MGHSIVDPEKLARRLNLRPGVDRAALARLGEAATAEIELVTGRSWAPARTGVEITITPLGALPFAPIPDIQLASPPARPDPPWAIGERGGRHPVAAVLQLARLRQRPATTPLGLAEALVLGGELISVAWLGRERWDADAATQLADWREAVGTETLVRTLLDPDQHVISPIANGGPPGWWLQVSRRLRLITTATPDDPVVVTPIADFSGDGAALVAEAPVGILAPVGDNPVPWAFLFRLWPIPHAAGSGGWRLREMPGVVHRYGHATITLDDASSAAEDVAQLLLAAWWHGLLTGSEPELASSLVRAFPAAIGVIRAVPDVTDDLDAATRLLVALQRGFDYPRGAKAVRAYLAALARGTALKERRLGAVRGRSRLRPSQAVDLTSEETALPWQRVGLSESQFYRRLAGYTTKIRGRYQTSETVLEAMRADVETRRGLAERQAAARELLEGRGFAREAARKALQRHSLDWVRTARPRRPEAGSQQR